MGKNYDWAAYSKWTSSVTNYHQSIGFDAGGSRYVCVCGIVSEDGDSITIDNNNINHFEWTNEVNNFCLYGFAEIVDSTGKIGEIFSKYFCHLVFEIKKLTDGAKRTDGQFPDTSESSSVFKHAFIVNNFEIVRRTRQFVVYRLYLVAIEWYGLAQTILFSNYDVKLPENQKSNELIESLAEWVPENLKGKIESVLNVVPGLKAISKLTGKVNAMRSKLSSSGSSSIASLFSGGSGQGETPTEVFSIIKSFLSQSFENKFVYPEGNKPTIDSKTFESKMSNVNLHACFGYDFTILDAVKFLLNKLYYNEFQGKDLVHDDLLKMIVYDEFKNLYSVIEYGVDDSADFINGTGDTLFVGTWESLFGSQFESLITPVEQDLESVVKKSAIDSLRSFFRKVYHYFTLDGFQNKLIDSDEIMAYSNNDKSIPKIQFQKYKPKMGKELFEKFFDPKQSVYETHGSSWSNDFTIYLDQVMNLINKDVLVLHTKGDITHRPGMKFGIISDAVVNNDMNANSLDSKGTKNANKEITGLYNVVKVKHIVKPNSREKDNFMEKLFLSRNFVAEKK